MRIFIAAILTIITFGISQDLDMSLEDINPNSLSQGDFIGPGGYENLVNIYYFGHQN